MRLYPLKRWHRDETVDLSTDPEMLRYEHTDRELVANLTTGSSGFTTSILDMETDEFAVVPETWDTLRDAQFRLLMHMEYFDQ